jgi:hypothetical protein
MSALAAAYRFEAETAFSKDTSPIWDGLALANVRLVDVLARIK